MMPHRATAALVQCARDYPDCWRRMDQLIFDARKSGVAWPSWCWAPLAAAYAVVSDGTSLAVERVPDVARLAALSAWRPTQGIYRFDETLLDELWDSDVDGALPTETLHHLPEWCVYVETPGRQVAGLSLQGFWVHLEADDNDGHSELRFLLDSGEGMVPLPLHLGHGRGTLSDAGVGVVEVAAAQSALLGDGLLAQRLIGVGSDYAKFVRPLGSLVLYLCTTAEEVVSTDGRRPSKPPPAPARRGAAPRTYPPAAPAVFPTGLRIGASLRASRNGSSAERGGASVASPLGHVRRAHWHTYLLGPRDGSQRREVRWLPPILVNLAPDSVPPVVRMVEASDFESAK